MIQFKRAILFCLSAIICQHSLAYTTTTVTTWSCASELELYNAFYDWTSNTSYGGGQLAGDDGAVCVANKNDTDGDGTVDYQDGAVIENTLGRNEVDLIKIRIENINPNELPEDGDLTINVQGSTPVSIWRNPDKNGSPLTLPYSFTNSDFLPVELYLEAESESQSVGDIVVELSKSGFPDQVATATAVWLILDNTYTDRSAMPSPSSLGIKHCLQTKINLLLANDDTRYGPGTFSYNGSQGVDQSFGGRILFQFELLPGGADELISIDGTRQRKTRHHDAPVPECWFEPAGEAINENFWYEEGEDNEKPNDDKDSQCPITQVFNGYFYTFDSPSTIRTEEQLEDEPFPQYHDFKTDKTNFYEFVRVSVAGYDFNPNPHGSTDNGNRVAGSRASPKVAWSNSYNTIKDGEFLLSSDNIPQSVSQIRNGDYVDDTPQNINFQFNTINTNTDYELGNYHATVFQPFNGERDILLLRMNTSTDGTCTEIAEDLEMTIPANATTYTLDFSQHSVEITEQSPQDMWFFNWKTFRSFNKDNSIQLGHFSSLNR